MPESYRAILVDGQLRWLEDVPERIRHGTERVCVRVTVEEGDPQDQSELRSLLDDIAEDDPFSGVEDPVDWQRRLRREDLT